MTYTEYLGSVNLYRPGQDANEPWRNDKENDRYIATTVTIARSTITGLVDALLAHATSNGYCHAEADRLEAYCGVCKGAGKLFDRSKVGRVCPECKGQGYWEVK